MKNTVYLVVSAINSVLFSWALLSPFLSFHNWGLLLSVGANSVALVLAYTMSAESAGSFAASVRVLVRLVLGVVSALIVPVMVLLYLGLDSTKQMLGVLAFFTWAISSHKIDQRCKEGEKHFKMNAKGPVL